MKRASEKDFNKIQQALSFAYQKRDETTIGDAWQNRVMARVRNSEIRTSPFGFMAAFEQYFWRLTPVATLALLVLGCIIYQQLSSFSDYEIVSILVENTLGNPLSQLLGAS